MTTIEERLYGPGPKRILALDGGGVRGALTLEYLARIEAILRDRTGDGDDFRLCQYFDLIGGTSTGSIIAALLATGRTVAEIQQLYRALADEVFEKRWWRKGILAPKYEAGRIRRLLDEQFGAETLGGPSLQTGLVVVAKRLDSGSPWPMTNFPRGKYFGPRPNSTAIPNRDFPLAQVVRASTAAPSYFDGEDIEVVTGRKGRFIDGGVSTANNPALLLFLIARLSGFTLNWPCGEDNLLLVSIGTGAAPAEVHLGGLAGVVDGAAAVKALVSIMTDADALNRTILQSISHTKTPSTIDREIGDCSGDLLSGEPLLTYLRYNVELDHVWLKDTLGYPGVTADVARRLCEMDNPSSVVELAKLGAFAAELQVLPTHFPPAFDVP